MSNHPSRENPGASALPRRSQMGTGNKRRLAQREGAKPHCPWVRNWTDSSMCSSAGHRFQNKHIGSCGITEPFVSVAPRALFSLSSQYSNCHKISSLAGAPNLVLLTKVFPLWQEKGPSWSWQQNCSLRGQGILQLYPNSGQSSLNTPTCPSHKFQHFQIKPWLEIIVFKPVFYLQCHLLSTARFTAFPDADSIH